MSDPFTTNRHALDPAIGNLWGVNGVNIDEGLHWLPNVSDLVSGYVELEQKQTTRTSMCLFWKSARFPNVTSSHGVQRRISIYSQARTMKKRSDKNIQNCSFTGWCAAWCLTWSMEHGFLTRIFGPKRAEVAGGCCRSHNDALRKLTCKLKMWRRTACISEEHPVSFV